LAQQSTQNSKQKLVIIDGLSFFFRAYHAVRPLTRASDGLHTNALYGFSQMLIKVVRELEPDLCCVALDSKQNFRYDLYPNYKANRSEPDEEMLEQFPYFEPLIEAFGIPGLRVDGYEADDIIATLATTHRNTFDVTIVSSDKDLMQLLGDGVIMLDTMKSKVFDVDEVNEKFGVGPDKVIEVQALIGDSSDNVPGVPGVGPKTAAKLMAEYGSLDGIYEHVEEIKQNKLRENLIAHKDNAYLSKQLVTLKQDIDLGEMGLDKNLLFNPTADKAREFLISMDFKTLAGRLTDTHMTNGKSGVKTLQNVGSFKLDDAETVDTPEKLDAWVKRLDKAKAANTHFAFDTETTGLDALTADLVGISLGVKDGENLAACYIPVGHTGDLLEAPQQLPKNTVLDALRPYFEDDSVKKVAHNLKYDLLVMKKAGVAVKGADDTMLMSFSLFGGLHNHGLDGLAKRYLDYTTIPFKDICGTGKKQITFDKADITHATKYAAEDAAIALELYSLFKPQLDEAEGPKRIYEEIELPLVPVIAAMEARGVEVCQNELASLSKDFAERMATHEKKVFEIAGEEFNLNSPKQLGEILFGKLEIEGGKKTKTGYSTNEETLNRLAEEGHDIANEVLAYRSLAKLKSTYSDALQEQIAADGRVHTSYNQTGAATGRFSSSDPNLQNIPIRSEDGRKIRHAFVAAKNHTLVSADYSQIELRLLAHMAEVESLIKAFNNGGDIHAHTASEIFDVNPEDVTPNQRSAAKTINFGIVYGMGPYALAKNLGIDNKTAKQYIDNYFARYDGIKTFLDETKEFAKEHGYVETLYGRRVHVPNINEKNRMLVAGAERAAINAPLQGSNADIIKIAMKQLEDILTGEKADLGVKMLMQVHDELIFEVPDEHLEEAMATICKSMENVIKLKVPLKVGADSGATWEDAH